MAAITIKQLEAFVAVADLGTFRRAADRLNTTQPNISNRIAQLEEQLGLQLMERDAGSVRLTSRGLALLDHARRVIAEMDALVTAAGDTSLFAGVLRLGVSEMVAHTWLSRFLKDMRARYPSVDVELTVDLSADLSRALFDRDLDLVFQSAPFDRPALGTVTLGSSPYAWVAAPALGLGGRLGESDLARSPILAHARGTQPFAQLERHFRMTGQPVRLVPSSNIGTCLQMVLDGLGIACLPQAMVAPYVSDGRLERLDYEWTPDALHFAARYVTESAPEYLRGAIAIAERLSPPDQANSSL